MIVFLILQAVSVGAVRIHASRTQPSAEDVLGLFAKRRDVDNIPLMRSNYADVSDLATGITYHISYLFEPAELEGKWERERAW